MYFFPFKFVLYVYLRVKVISLYHFIIINFLPMGSWTHPPCGVHNFGNNFSLHIIKICSWVEFMHSSQPAKSRVSDSLHHKCQYILKRNVIFTYLFLASMIIFFHLPLDEVWIPLNLGSTLHPMMDESESTRRLKKYEYK